MGLAVSRLFFAGLALAAAVGTVLGAPIASPEATLLDMPRWRWKAKGSGPPKRPTDKPALTPFSEDTSDGPAEPATLDARWDWGSTLKDNAPDTTDAAEKRRWLKLLSDEEDAPDADAVDKRAESTLRGRNRRGRGGAPRARGGRRRLESGRGYVKEEPRTDAWQYGELEVSDSDDAVKKRDASPDQIWTLFSDSEKPGSNDPIEERSPECHYPVEC